MVFYGVLGETLGVDDYLSSFLPMDVESIGVTSEYSRVSRAVEPHFNINARLKKNLIFSYSSALSQTQDTKLKIELRLNERSSIIGSYESYSDGNLPNLGVDYRLRWER